MLELVVTVCLMEEVTRCKDVKLTLMEGTPMQCMMSSPVEIAKWSEGHPKWFAKKWSCRRAGMYADM